MEIAVPILAALAVILAAALILVVYTSRKAHSASQGDELAQTMTQTLAQTTEVLKASQAEMEARLQSENRALSEKLHVQELKLSKTLQDGLSQSTRRTLETMGKLEARLAVIDKAQANITALSSQVISLQDILSNKQARGAFGEIQLNDLVSQMLPPAAYSFQVTLSNKRRADCMLILPNPPGPIVIDAKFPLESYRALQDAADEPARQVAARAFRSAIQTHVNAIAERYIVPGETADAALMFLPSEAVYAELHANFTSSVEAAFRSRVYIVSPTTLWATLNTVRAILKDVRMHEQSGLIQNEVRALLDDVGRLDTRVGNLLRHLEQAGEDIRQIRISTDKVARRGERIEDVQLVDDDDTALVVEPSEPDQPSLPRP